eukprot:CAMPEP_0113538276 /NCGR_PEP_ID=MMETSP0015_2-20120614/7277_1 /TAXON_ID=2838 /ORGANISM="Odontella" /LENGTH=417 /DNA_ID=CAMNT_0000437835 /DNA_START=81 /DNA_END=1332 /DNA_ORIENTATION=+ /assembly_acc=CAM_ASM_000160
MERIQQSRSRCLSQSVCRQLQSLLSSGLFGKDFLGLITPLPAASTGSLPDGPPAPHPPPAAARQRTASAASGQDCTGNGGVLLLLGLFSIVVVDIDDFIVPSRRGLGLRLGGEKISQGGDGRREGPREGRHAGMGRRGPLLLLLLLLGAAVERDAPPSQSSAVATEGAAKEGGGHDAARRRSVSNLFVAVFDGGDDDDLPITDASFEYLVLDAAQDVEASGATGGAAPQAAAVGNAAEAPSAASTRRGRLNGSGTGGSVGGLVNVLESEAGVGRAPVPVGGPEGGAAPEVDQEAALFLLIGRCWVVFRRLGGRGYTVETVVVAQAVPVIVFNHRAQLGEYDRTVLLEANVGGSSSDGRLPGPGPLGNDENESFRDDVEKEEEETRILCPVMSMSESSAATEGGWRDGAEEAWTGMAG